MRLPGGFLAAVCLLATHAGHAQPQAALCDADSDTGVEEALRSNLAHAAACHARALALIRHASTHDYRLAHAERIYRALQRYYPQEALAYIGFAELKMRRLELGIDKTTVQTIYDDAERATRIRPVRPEAVVTLGRAEMLMGCVPCAARQAEIARALGADTPELSVLRSRIAETDGDAAQARAVLEQAIAVPSLAAKDRSWLQASLAELLARLGRFDEADRTLALAVAADADNLPARIRRAEIRLFNLGDVQGALHSADDSRRARSSTEFKRVRAMAQYLQWAQDRIAGRSAADLRRIVQASYLGPEEALIACARHPALAPDFKLLLEAGLVRDVNARDGASNTALIAAAAGGNRDAARLLIARSADVNAADWRLRRPLSFAVERSDHETVALLLGAGAAVEFTDIDGRSPLLLAVQKGDGESVGLLLRHRPGKSAPPPDGAGEMLATAAIRGDDRIVRTLLEAGIPVDTPDRRGRTALTVAVLWGHARAALVFLDAGADASRALEAAQESGNGAMLDLLKPYIKRSI